MSPGSDTLGSQGVQELRRAILGRHPLIYLWTWEEDRALRLLEGFAPRVPEEGHALATWSCIEGVVPPMGDQDLRDPAAAIQAVIETSKPGVFVFKDLSAFMGRPEVVRSLRSAYYALRGSNKVLVVLAPDLVIPETLKEIYLVELGLPGREEIQRLIEAIGGSYSENELSQELASELSLSLTGMTLGEAYHTLHRIFRRRLTRERVLREAFADKANVVKKLGYLEFVAQSIPLGQLGGLDNLKEWLRRREPLFSPEALEAGVPVPKGVLIMGISGCGKSFAAKSISALWKIPLFRLDMNLVFSGVYGSPEAAFHRALKTMETLAPGILWIDEIENALGLGGSESETNQQIFSSFLTWMQEKPPLVFVAATANRIEVLPAEFIRKGRFDQIYFVDLPVVEERRQIFEIHLRRNGAEVGNFEVDALAAGTPGWNGAEIEQAIIAARVDAYGEDRSFDMDDVARHISTMVPLSKTMAEQMKRIRAWAFGRAEPASRYDSTRPR